MVEMQLFQYNLTVLQQVVLRKPCLQNSCLVAPVQLEVRESDAFT